MTTLRERVAQVLPTLSAKGITSLRAWCRAANVSESYVNRRMHSEGGRPDFQRFQRLADVAGVNAAWLAYGIERIAVIDDVHVPPDQASDANAPRIDPEADRLVELSSLPNWPSLLEAAKARASDKNRHLPDWVWDAVGGASLRIVGTPEPVGVYELAVVHFENGWGRPREDVTKAAKG